MTARQRVLVVDDEPDMAESCAFFLDRAGYEVATANSGPDALALMERSPFSVVITDLKMPRMSGMTLLERVRERDPDVEVLVITGHPDVDSAVEAMKLGALDYIRKPFTEQEFMARVDKALAHRRVRDSNRDLRERLRSGAPGSRLVWRSETFGALIATLERAARTDASVLLIGESGTGKELLAHHLHDLSQRAGHPFVPVDCTTMPESLVESELFGHKRGAFTGAERDRVGLFQVADGGTLFLDEVGELPLSFQPKLLRAIQERQIRRVGAQSYESVDVRIVGATNRDLGEMVERGEFRQDLFYRLDVVRIVVPPLRERPEDVALIAERFLAEFAAETDCRAERFTAGALAAMRSYSWPGNVRQLRNAVERACALGTSREIGADDLPPEIFREDRDAVVDEKDLGSTFQEMKARKVAAIESAYLEALLQRHNGNVTRCAEEAGVSRSAFQKLMQRYAIKSRDFRE